MPRIRKELDEAMEADGYVAASTARELCLFAHVSSIHRQIAAGKIVGLKTGAHWYVTISSLADANRDNPVIAQRIAAYRKGMVS